MPAGFDAINKTPEAIPCPHFTISCDSFHAVSECARTAFNPKTWSPIALHKNVEKMERKRRNLHEYAFDHVFALPWPLEMVRNVRVCLSDGKSPEFRSMDHIGSTAMPSRTNFPLTERRKQIPATTRCDIVKQRVPFVFDCSTMHFHFILFEMFSVSLSVSENDILFPLVPISELLLLLLLFEINKNRMLVCAQSIDSLTHVARQLCCALLCIQCSVLVCRVESGDTTLWMGPTRMKLMECSTNVRVSVYSIQKRVCRRGAVCVHRIPIVMMAYTLNSLSSYNAEQVFVLGMVKTEC